MDEHEAMFAMLVRGRTEERATAGNFAVQL